MKPVQPTTKYNNLIRCLISSTSDWALIYFSSSGFVSWANSLPTKQTHAHMQIFYYVANRHSIKLYTQIQIQIQK